MTRAQTIDVLNDTTTMQSRIDTVLATPDLDWSNDSGWQPGDPLYADPRTAWAYNPNVQYVRRMFDLIDEYAWPMRCRSCEVDWRGPEACWLCGDPATERQPFGFSERIVLADQWAAAMREAMRPVVEQMRRMAEEFDQLARRTEAVISTRGGSLTFTISGAVLQSEPDTAIRFPAELKVTPDQEFTVPELTAAAIRPDLYRSRSESFWADAPATEARRPRRTA